MIRKKKALKLWHRRFRKRTQSGQTLCGSPTCPVFFGHIAESDSGSEGSLEETVKSPLGFEAKSIFRRAGLNVMHEQRQRIGAHRANRFRSLDLSRRGRRQGRGTDAENLSVVETLEPLGQGFSLINRLTPFRLLQVIEHSQDCDADHEANHDFASAGFHWPHFAPNTARQQGLFDETKRVTSVCSKP